VFLCSFFKHWTRCCLCSLCSGPIEQSEWCTERKTTHTLFTIFSSCVAWYILCLHD